MQLQQFRVDGRVDRIEVPTHGAAEAKVAALAAVAAPFVSGIYRAKLVDPLAGDRVLWDSYDEERAAA